MTDARIGGLVTQVPVVIDPTTVAARIGGILAQVVVYAVPQPTSVVASQISTTQIDLTWAAPVDGKTLLRYEVNIDGGAPINKGASLSHSFTGLTTGHSYEMGVRFLDTSGNVSEWIYRGLTVLASFSDNPFDDTPWMASDPNDKTSKKWMPFEYIGAGVQVEDLLEFDDSVGRVRIRSEIVPMVQDGENRRQMLWEILANHLQDGTVELNPAITHSGAGSSTNTPLSLYYLTPGIWRVKLTAVEWRNATSINGGMYFSYSGGTVTHFLFTKKFVSTATAANTNRVYNASTDTSRKAAGGTQRVLNNRFSEPDINEANVDSIVTYTGVVVVTATTRLIVIGYSGTGGGNNLSIRENSNMSFRKMG